MKRIDINFAPRSIRRSVATIHPLAWLSAIVGLILLASVMRAGYFQLQKYDSLSAELRIVDMQANRHWVQTASKQRKYTISEQQESSVNGAIDQLNIPWNDLLLAVENATPATIALLALEPDPRSKVLKATAEAKDSEGMFDYLKSLKKQAFFGDVVLTKHEMNEQDPNRPIRFQFEAPWIAPSNAESAEE